MPTYLIYHGGEGCLHSCLASLYWPDLMGRPILGRREHLEELRGKCSFNADVLEGEAGWVRGASQTTQGSQMQARSHVT